VNDDAQPTLPRAPLPIVYLPVGKRPIVHDLVGKCDCVPDFMDTVSHRVMLEENVRPALIR
jgi:hypothetical protein